MIDESQNKFIERAKPSKLIKLEEDRKDYLTALEVEKNNKEWISHEELIAELGL